VIKPVVRTLPPSKSDRIETLLHYTKLTLAGGHVIPFRSMETPPSPAPDDGGADMALLRAPQERCSAEAQPPSAEQEVHKAVAAPLLPAWALNEMRELADIEPSLYPTPELIATVQRYTTPNRPNAGSVYAECYPQVRDARPDLIILAPWLKPGGADQGILHHAEAAVAAGKSVVVIATLDVDSPWAERLPAGAHFVPLGRRARGLAPEEARSVLVRILLQAPARTIHIINSPLGWDVVRHHGKSLRAVGKAIFASVFCDDYDANGVRWSYAQLYFPSCLPYLSGIFCDTTAYPRTLMQRFGVRPDLFHTLYFPHAVPAAPRYRAGSRRSVLWAGRFSRQKRVDLLESIARAMPDTVFEVHGCGPSPEELAIGKRLASMDNVRVCGPFRSLADIAGDGDHAAFLYTSAWDGLPIVLLDATAAGLPIVASGVGGVGEFITDSTGVLVPDADDVGGYVQGLRLFIDQPNVARSRWEQAEGLLERRHAASYFRTAVGKVPGYLE
jgi:glycosyltransferase involved in cell wall biosynthesis